MHLYSLTSTFVIHYLERIVANLVSCKISIFLLVPVAEQTSLCLTFSETPEDRFCHVKDHLLYCVFVNSNGSDKTAQTYRLNVVFTSLCYFTCLKILWGQFFYITTKIFWPDYAILLLLFANPLLERDTFYTFANRADPDPEALVRAAWPGSGLFAYGNMIRYDDKLVDLTCNFFILFTKLRWKVKIKFFFSNYSF